MAEVARTMRAGMTPSTEEQKPKVMPRTTRVSEEKPAPGGRFQSFKCLRTRSATLYYGARLGRKECVQSPRHVLPLGTPTHTHPTHDL